MVLVNYVNALRKEKDSLNIFEVVIEGISNRLRAILTTTFTTVASLLPLASVALDEIMTPMALALRYGLLFATFLTLGLVPCFYVIGQDIGKLLGNVKKSHSETISTKLIVI